MGAFRRYRDTFIVIVLLAVPFFVLRANIRRPENMTGVDRAIMRVAAPVQYASAVLARGMSSLVSDYVYLVDVKRNNDRLAYDNARLQSELRDLSSLRAENQRLRKLLALRESLEVDAVSAVVVAKDPTEFFRVAHLTLDSTGSGIQPKMPVVSPDGAVGTVFRVSGDKVDVQLTVEAGFGVDVVVERTGSRGFVRGVGERSRYLLRVEYVRRTDEVEVGDLLLTSGGGCRFPKGIPVAKVTDVKKRDFGIYQEVEAEPTVDFSRLEEVLVLLIDTKDCEPRREARKRG